MSAGRILLTGATGRVGRVVAAQLPLRTRREVAVLLRDGTRPTEDFPGVTVVRGDLRRPSEVDAAMAGVDTLFLLTPDAPDQGDWETDVIGRAARAGVARIVKLSAQSAGLAPPRSFGRHHHRAEEALAAAGPRWTVLRPTFFQQSLLLFAADVRAKRTLRAPIRGGAVAAVDARDVGEVAARVLADDTGTHDGQVVHLSGPSAVTFSEVAEELTRLTAREVAFRPVPPAVARVALPLTGVMPWWMAGEVVDLFRALDAGAQSGTDGTTARLLGRPARSVPAFLREHVDEFLPAAAEAAR